MVGFRDLVGTDFAPVSNKTAVKGLVIDFRPIGRPVRMYNSVRSKRGHTNK